jgi:GR25 family glycosyltransferase involved in LPS biosynthesis
MTIKFYIIRKKDDELSESLSSDAINSALRFGIDVEKVDGLYKNDAIDYLKSRNLSPYIGEDGKETKFTSSFSRKGVLASHYFLWEKCVNCDLPIGILEHDAIFVRGIPNDILEKFDDILNFDFISRPFKNGKLLGKFFRKKSELYKAKATEKKELEIKKFNGYSSDSLVFNTNSISNSYIRGVHGYIIKPSGANKLMNAATKYGYLTADAHINTFFVDIFYTTPSVVMINDFFCNTSNYEKFSHCHNDQF